MSEPVNCRCGGEAVVEKHQLYEEQIEDMFIVRCIKCDIQTSPEYKKEKAIEVWNRVMGTTEKSSTVEQTAKVETYTDDQQETWSVCECGTDVWKSYNYCPECGAKLDWSKEQYEN